MSLIHGSMHMSGVRTQSIDQRLGTDYTLVRTSVHPQSKVRELGLECNVNTSGLSIAFTHMRGLHIAIYRTVEYGGPPVVGVLIPGQSYFTLHQHVNAHILRVSALQHIELGWADPFVRLGVGRVHGVQHVSIPVGRARLEYEEPKSITAPFVGAGITFGRGDSVSYRIEYQLLSPAPRRLYIIHAGVLVRFRG
jgi:hypothetical protein